jgi:hypothetical protein
VRLQSALNIAPGQTTLKTAWRADAEERPHPEAEIEGAGRNEQPLEHVLLPAHVRAPELPVS